jgi:antitoxin CptB
MKELDELFERYMAVRYDDAPETEQRDFARLLELHDPEIFAYLLGRKDPEDPSLSDVIDRIRDPVS